MCSNSRTAMWYFTNFPGNKTPGLALQKAAGRPGRQGPRAASNTAVGEGKESVEGGAEGWENGREAERCMEDGEE